MFDAPIDGLLAWLGLGVCSLAVAGIALSLPATTPPAASAVAAQVDEVATSEHRVASTVPLRAERWRIRGSQLSLRRADTTAHARLVSDGVVAAETAELDALLSGEDPARVYADRSAFVRALDRARSDAGDWRPAPERLRIRRVTWGDVDATIVG